MSKFSFLKTFLLSFIGINLILVLYRFLLYLAGEEQVGTMEFWSQVATGVLSSVIVSAGAFFLILRKLPDKIEKRINERIDVITKLLNPDNALIFSQLNPDNAYLSKEITEHDRNLVEHDKYTRAKTVSILNDTTGLKSDIKDLVKFKNKEEGRREATREIMTKDQRAYAELLDKMEHSKAIMEYLVIDNQNLREDINFLRQENLKLSQKISALSSRANKAHDSSLDDDNIFDDDENEP